MILKKRNYLFLLVIVLLAFGCGSKKSSEEASNKNNVIKAKSYDEVSEIDFSNKDMDANTLQNIILEEKENPELKESYKNLDISYLLTFFPDIFHKEYEKNFLDNKNNFIIPDENKINSFLTETENVDYEELKKDIDKVKEEQKKEIKLKNEDLSNAAREFLSSLEEKIKNIEEIKIYYKNGKYKEDNFEKGKILSEQYLTNQKKTEDSFGNFRKQRKKVRYTKLKNAIGVLEDMQGKKVEADIMKLVLLMEKTNDKFVGKKLYLDTSNPLL